MNATDNPYAPPAAIESAPGIEWMQTETSALSKTALGLSLVYWGIVVFLLSIILSFPVGFLFPPALLVTLSGMVLASIMMFVGPLLCLSVPAETNAKGLIGAAVILQLINFVLSILPVMGVDLAGFESFSQIFGVLSAIFFVLFMRRLAEFIGRTDLAKSAGNVLVMGIVVIGTAIAGFALMFVLGPIAGLALLLVMVLGLVLFIMYANLINALRKALKSN